MKNKHFSRYYLLASLGVLAASFYPLYMGTKVVWDMIANGTVIPSVVSGLMTLLMYFGEMVLLHGHLYQYGTGFFFRSLPVIVLAPVDICLVFLSGIISAGIFYRLNKSVS